MDLKALLRFPPVFEGGRDVMMQVARETVANLKKMALRLGGFYDQ